MNNQKTLTLAGIALLSSTSSAKAIDLSAEIVIEAQYHEETDHHHASFVRKSRPR